MTFTKKTRDSRCRGGRDDKGAVTCCQRECALVQRLWNKYGDALKNKRRSTRRVNSVPCGCITIAKLRKRPRNFSPPEIFIILRILFVLIFFPLHFTNICLTLTLRWIIYSDTVVNKTEMNPSAQRP